MRTITCISLSLLLALLAVSCTESSPQGTAAETPAGATGDLNITLQPDALKPGENTFTVTVKKQDGTPVTDADVSVEFYMPAMPSMNMAEMRNSIPLRHDAGGTYRGTGNVAMAGAWDVTVAVTQAGKQIGSRRLTVQAQ